MEVLLVCAASLLASGLTLFSGFGLGTLLLPVFALFFSPAAAVATTGVVHLLNNLFKLALLGRHADGRVVLRFGLPALAASFAGAWILGWVAELPAWLRYELFGRAFETGPLELSLGALILVFAAFELLPRLRDLRFEPRFLPWGGLLSGFFGGFSGHQGALRSAFLLKCGLSKEGFLGTGIAIACLVDLARLGVYGARFSWSELFPELPLLVAAVLSAFLGAWLGARLVGKATMRGIQVFVGIGLALLALALGAGLI